MRPFATATTVRQTPLIATESPTVACADVVDASISSQIPPPRPPTDATWPTSRTIPVNTSRRLLRTSRVAVVQRLAFARLVSLAGGSAAYIALVAAIYGETGSALRVSAAIFSSVVASVASAPFAGWIGDRFDRRGVLIGADAAAAVVSLAMAATAAHAPAL